MEAPEELATAILRFAGSVDAAQRAFPRSVGGQFVVDVAGR
jgi:hypothetical protein